MPRQNRGMRKRVKGRLHMAAPYIDDFKSWLRNSGYKATTIEELVRLLAYWTDWAHAAGFTVNMALAAFDASRVAFKGSRTGREVINAGALFVRHLQDRGVVPRPQPSTPQKRVRPILDAFRAWMRSHRGIAESTLDTYETTLVDLLDAAGDPSAVGLELRFAGASRPDAAAEPRHLHAVAGQPGQQIAQLGELDL